MDDIVSACEISIISVATQKIGEHVCSTIFESLGLDLTDVFLFVISSEMHSRGTNHKISIVQVGQSSLTGFQRDSGEGQTETCVQSLDDSQTEWAGSLASLGFNDVWQNEFFQFALFVWDVRDKVSGLPVVALISILGFWSKEGSKLYSEKSPIFILRTFHFYKPKNLKNGLKIAMKIKFIFAMKL